MPYDVDINNLPLNEEDESSFPQEVDPSANYYGGGAPVDDGKHQAKLSISTKFPNVRADNDPNTGKPKYYAIFVSNQIIEPGTTNDGRFASTDFVSTQPMENGSCKAVAVLIACAVPVEEIPKSQAGVIKKLFETLQGQPMVTITTQWQARPRDKDANGKSRKPVLKGQRNFPEGKDGRKLFVVEDPETGEEITADAVVTKYTKID